MKNNITLLLILTIGILSGQSTLDPDNIVVGTDQLPTGTSTDSVFYFHKNTMSWRAGFFENGIAKPRIERKWNAAWGRNNDIDGDFSTGWGNVNTTSALHATVWGETNSVTGNFGTAWGKSNEVTGSHSTAWGTENIASGSGSTVWGGENKATGNLSTSWGGESQANGDLSTAWGIGNRADSTGATAWGVVNKSLNYHATAWGRDNQALGIQSTVIGQGNGTRSKNALVAGQFNEFVESAIIIDVPIIPGQITFTDEFGNEFTGEDTHKLFVIGNGDDTNNRSNAVTVTKSGRLGIGTSLPANRIHIPQNEKIQLGDRATIKGDGFYLETNATISPEFDNSAELGSSSKRWHKVYAALGVVTTSDIRLKENIKQVENALSKVEKLNPIYYNLISNPEERQIGFSAQALEDVVPEAINKVAYIKDNGEKDHHYGVNYSELIPVLTKAIQEQQTLIEQTQLENSQLKSTIDNLKIEIYQIRASIKS